MTNQRKRYAIKTKSATLSKLTVAQSVPTNRRSFL